MKILHLIPSYLPATLASGPIKPTHYLNKNLVKKGIEVVVYTMNMDGEKKLDVPLEKEVNLEGVKVFYFPMTFLPWQYSYKLHRALAENIKNFDLVHITSVFLSVSTLGAYYAKKFKKPYIISPHGSLMNEPLKHHSFKKWFYVSLFERRNLKNASAIHFTVEREKEDYLKVALPFKKAIVIPNGLDLEEFKYIDLRSQYIDFKKKFGIRIDRKIILFLARLHWIKGLDTLIPAFAEVVRKEPKAILVLAGQDNSGYKRNIEEMIKERNLKDNLIFTGSIWGEEKIAALSESNLFVLPSYTEACSMAMIEAMHFGLPIVITKNNGLASYVKKFETGLVIDKNVKQLAEAILKILNNPDLAKKMGENGKKLVEEEFNPEKIANKWIEEYNKIIKNV